MFPLPPCPRSAPSWTRWSATRLSGVARWAPSCATTSASCARCSAWTEEHRMPWFLESTKGPGLFFEIVKLDKATMRATLKGQTGVPFERSIAQDELTKYGYKIAKREAVP